MDPNNNIIKQLENGTHTDKIIEIKSLYKNGKTTVMPVKDYLTGWYLGVDRLSDDDKKKLRFWAEPNSKFILRDGVTFNLNDEQQRVIWNWVKYQPCLLESYDRCQTVPEGEFYIHLKNKEAEERVTAKQRKLRAFKLIEEDNPVNYPLKAKLLGVNMDGEKDVIQIKDFLFDIAETHPDKVINVYEDSLVHIRILVMKGVENGKITIDPSGAYRYGNFFMGMSENSAVEFLNSEDQTKTLKLLEADVNPEYFDQTGNQDKSGQIDLDR